MSELPSKPAAAGPADTSANTSADASNPYRAPQARIEDRSLEAHGIVAGQGRKLPASAGIDWWKAGWEQFRRAPGPWVGACALFVLISVAVSVLPLVNFFQGVLDTVLLGGLYMGCRDADAGQRFRFACLFDGFSRNTAQLALLGLLVSLSFVAFFLFAGIMAGLFGLSFNFIDSSELTIGVFAVIIALVALLFLVGLMAAYWSAVPLVVGYALRAGDALRLGFSASLRNWLPFLVFGLIGLLLSILVTLSFGIGILVFIPVSICAAHASTRAIFDA